ncbi:MAG: NADH-quinone oxidoreductase subunit I [Chloroflexi bacterium]|nr:NADH-quinone oxidoreductase subunit I [Chloroflexota bacterium]
MYGLGIAKGMIVTFKHLFRKPFTVQYPEEVVPRGSRFRGYEFTWYEDRCTGCASCAKYCPLGTINIVTHPEGDPKQGMDYAIDIFDIDTGRCMFCGLCVEACPYEAIQAGGPLDDATYDFESLYRDKHKLTEMAQEHLHGHDFTYPNGKQAPQPDEKPLHIGLPVERDRTR